MTDGHLIAQIRSGNGEAASALVERYYDACWIYALRMLGNRADTEDVVQETFFRALRSLERYEERQRFKAWLFCILTNRCRSRLLQRRRAQRHMSFENLQSTPEQLRTEQEFNLGEVQNTQFLSDLLQSALVNLPPRYREAFLLKHAEEMEYTQMSEITGASVSALKMRVKRAREILKPLLEEKYYAQ